MRTLVIGSLPPPPSRSARSLLADVLRRRRLGEDVTVVSPTPYSVAHRRLEFSGRAALVELALLMRGYDEVVVQLAPGFPVSASSRNRRSASLLGLAGCLKASSAPVVVRLDSAHDLPSGLGGRAALALWGRAARIEAGDEETADAFRALGPEVAAKVAVSGAPPEPAVSHERPKATSELESVTDALRQRAADFRLFLAGEPVLSPAAVPLSEWVPTPGAGVPAFSMQQGAVAPGGSVLRRAARAALYAAEARPATRNLARAARRARAITTGR